MADSNTVPKQLKPFVKGDPRINRKGRPKSFDALKAFTLTVWHEPAYGTDQHGNKQPIIIDGKHATNIEVAVRQMISSKDWRQRERALEIAFGKVPNVHEITGADGGPIELQIVEQIVASRNSEDEPASGASEVSG